MSPTPCNPSESEIRLWSSSCLLLEKDVKDTFKESKDSGCRSENAVRRVTGSNERNISRRTLMYMLSVLMKNSLKNEMRHVVKDLEFLASAPLFGLIIIC